MNYSGEEVSVYLDYYEKKESILLLSLLSDGETNYNGLIDWGITKTTEDTKTQTLFSELKLSGMGSSSQENLSFLSELLKEHSTYDQLIKDKIELTKNEPIPIHAWSSGGTYYLDFQDNFTEEAMKNREAFAVLYLLVK